MHVDPYRFLLAGRGVGAFGARREAELVHHPLRLGALAGAAAVEDEGLLEADGVAGATSGGGVYRPVDAGGLPEAGAGDPVGPDAVPVLPPSQAEEVPFLIPGNRARLCVIEQLHKISMMRISGSALVLHIYAAIDQMSC